MILSTGLGSRTAERKNAVILQPCSSSLPVAPLRECPTIYRMVKKILRRWLVAKPCEYVLNTICSEDPEFVPESERGEWSESQWQAYANTLGGNKIAGTPLFLQGDQFPGPGGWKLLLQLDSAQVPFFVNFGDAGVGYAFVSEDGRTAKFLWQCY